MKVKDLKWLERLRRIPLPKFGSSEIANQRIGTDGELTWNKKFEKGDSRV